MKSEIISIIFCEKKTKKVEEATEHSLLLLDLCDGGDVMHCTWCSCLYTAIPGSARLRSVGE